MAYLNVVKISEALAQMKDQFKPMTGIEQVPLTSGMGRILAEDLYAHENLPAFRRSMVDGYAVLAADVLGASEQSPILLSYSGQVNMGERSATVHETGVAFYVPTGGELPSGADAMIMIEHTERIGPDVAVFVTPKVGEHIVTIGEDVSHESRILEKGCVLKSQHMGLLASLGWQEVPVVPKIKVAIFSTGDELVEVWQKPQGGQVRDCNRYIIQGVVEACGCETVLSEHVVDDFSALQKALEKALRQSDLIILSGGSSAGTKDLTQAVIDSLPKQGDQSNVFIHGLAIKPGKPTLIGSVEQKAIIGLPGHPAACYITLKALVEPYISHLSGHSANPPITMPCVSNFQLHAGSGRDVYQLVRVNQSPTSGLWHADIIHGKSGMVSAMAQANAYVIIPMQQEGVMKGDDLTAYLL